MSCDLFEPIRVYYFCETSFSMPKLVYHISSKSNTLMKPKNKYLGGRYDWTSGIIQFSWNPGIGQLQIDNTFTGSVELHVYLIFVLPKQNFTKSLLSSARFELGSSRGRQAC